MTSQILWRDSIRCAAELVTIMAMVWADLLDMTRKEREEYVIQLYKENNSII
jgi:hypothetical protein